MKHKPWPLSTATAPRLDPSCLFEEEKSPYYHPDRFYPIKYGEILIGRYQIATKLGFGSSSTVWLARNLNQCVPQSLESEIRSTHAYTCGNYRWRWLKDKYVAVKVNASGYHPLQCKKSFDVEVQTLKQLSTTNPKRRE